MKAVVFTLGCKVNFCESSALINGLKSLGYETSDELGYADLYIINTCAVTGEAEKKSRQAVARVKKYNENAKIIITGCASEKAPEDFLNKEGVTLVTGTKSKDKILSMIEEKGEKIDDSADYYEEYLPAKTSNARAYIKVQDGCNNFCSYCIIPYLRGRSRSRDPQNVIKEIEYLSPAEAVITGINLTAYNYGGMGLTGLIESLKDVNCRIRLGSLEVNVIDEKFLSATKQLKDFAPHFHLSLQSGSNKVLKEMNRHYTREQFKEKVDLIRKFYPDAGITTDIIVGYSTETEQDFSDTLALVSEVEFSDVHCFPYSRREGTVGAKLKELAPEIKKDRLNRLIEAKEVQKDKFIDKNLGKILEFLPEEEQDCTTVGYTENYIRVYVNEKPKNKLAKVKLTEKYLDGAKAEIVK